MPTIPTVFRSIRSNDVHHRPFKVYKQYSINQNTYSGSGYVLQKAYHSGYAPTLGDSTTDYVTDSNFNTINNMHVVWNSLDHKYYRHPHDPAKCLELTNIDKVEKMLFYSASTIAAPYFEVGEKIKPKSLEISSTVSKFFNLADYDINLFDDGYGNLRDKSIDSSSFAENKNLKFYLSFNNEFRNFIRNTGTYSTANIVYKLSKIEKNALAENITIQNGVSVHAGSTNYFSSGLSAKFTKDSLSYVRIDDDKVYKSFNKCDQWSISLWVKPNATDSVGTILCKGGQKIEQKFDMRDSLIKKKIVNVPRPGHLNSASGDFSNYRTPFNISMFNEEIHFQASDGTSQLHISASNELRDGWMHVLVSNSASLCRLSINGNITGSSGSLPKDNTGNENFVFIGSDGVFDENKKDTAMGGFDGEIAEVRMYDYAVTENNMRSLANQNFYSASLYQTSVAGNSFYRNGQIVVSSPLPKYNNIFVSSSNENPGIFNIQYKGTHTIYENEVMIRVPKAACNISVNPSATFRPGTGDPNNCNVDGGNSEKFNTPGDFRKTMFLSGSALPYVTTIGLYNDKAQLLAVGKLAEAVQKRNDVDMNFIVRWDY